MTLDDLTFYKMQGEYFVRMKSRLTRKRVLESPRFALTRMHANQLAEASRIASLIYSQIPKEVKSIKLFRSIVGKAKILLVEGKDREQILRHLNSEFVKTIVVETPIQKNNTNNIVLNKSKVFTNHQPVLNKSIKKAKTLLINKRILLQRGKQRQGLKTSFFERAAAPYGAVVIET
jgi:hypothetical protein